MNINDKNIKPPGEWIFQAEYDIETAIHMFDAGRYIYSIFMAHLALEKAFKGSYSFILKENPPRTHNLILLQERIEKKFSLNFTDEQNEIIEILNEKSVPSRYPDVLAEVLKEFTKDETKNIIEQVKNIIQCIKTILTK